MPGISEMFVPNHGKMSMNGSMAGGIEPWIQIMRLRSHGSPVFQLPVDTVSFALT